MLTQSITKYIKERIYRFKHAVSYEQKINKNKNKNSSQSSVVN
jgi:hypothetical protein